MEEYLKQFYLEEITDILNDSNDSIHSSLQVNLQNLQRINANLFKSFIQNPHKQIIKWDQALLNAQKSILEQGDSLFLEPNYQIKENCHVRFIQLPSSSNSAGGSNGGTNCPTSTSICFPNNDHVGQFVQIKGNVVRMTHAKLLEYKREYICGKCKHIIICEAEYSKMYIFEAPKVCENLECTNKSPPYPKNDHPLPKYCYDIQEIRLQELLSDKNMPGSLVVTLDNDLVDCCQPGDCITVCGTVELRWKPQTGQGKRSEIMLTIRAISVWCDEKRQIIGRDLPEHLLCVRADWQDQLDQYGELEIRDTILKSYCPEIHGMYLVKLAIILAISSGGMIQQRLSTNTNNDTGNIRRLNSHLLLVGDPGLAKSKLLKFASLIAPRAIHTTGMGCSSAGLTAAAVKEGNEWQLEAGALVLADGGVCCIDELNLMRESDKASIHEAMEQQTISMAKAGLVCKLSTRCIILAATNPKNLSSIYESDGMAPINIGIATPLLSRFDIVLVLRDERNPDWDSHVADHVLNRVTTKNASATVTTTTNTTTNINKKNTLWNINKLQTHFMAIRDINPVISKKANEILGSYYKACRADPMRDPSRTSVRLLDSLVRLAQAHARLLFRNEVNELDAVLVVRLMESSWGLGKIIRQLDVLKENLPLGPTNENILELKRVLHLVDDSNNYDNNDGDDDDIDLTFKHVSQNSQEPNITCIKEPIIASNKTNESNSLKRRATTDDENLDLNQFLFNKAKIRLTQMPTDISQSQKCLQVIDMDSIFGDREDDDLSEDTFTLPATRITAVNTNESEDSALSSQFNDVDDIQQRQVNTESVGVLKHHHQISSIHSILSPTIDENEDLDCLDDLNF